MTNHDDVYGRVGECWQCFSARLGGQHTNGPCRCVKRCHKCAATGLIDDEPCWRCVGLTRPNYFREGGDESGGAAE